MDFDHYDHLSLLNQARTRNERLGITGMLLYSDCRFVQALEGEKETVLSLYKDIQDDARHYNLTTLAENSISKRMFPDWTMGYKNIDLEQYRNIPGLSLFLDDEKISEPYRILLHFKDDPSCFQQGAI